MTGIDSLVDRLKQVPLAAAANARLKAWMVERDARVTARRCAADLARRGLVVPAGEALRVALGARIAQRAQRLRWPRPHGDLHVFLVYGVTNWESVLPQALTPFGQVSEFEWRGRGFDEWAPDWLRRREQMNAELLAAFEAAQRRRPVDVVVAYASGATVAPEVLRHMAAQGAVTTNFCFDDKTRWPGEVRGGRFTSPAALAAAVDLNLTSDPTGPDRYFAHGGLAMFHPEAADPGWFRPLDLPFDYDVSFVGACYGWRPTLIHGLRRRGIEVACFGKGWPNGPIANEAMNELYARSRINLGCGGIGFSHRLLCLKGRDFEVPMSGAVYLTQHNPELSLVFDVGREILTYRDIDDCADIIRRTLADPGAARRLRAAARARALRDHSYAARWSGVLRMLGAVAP
jgi:hypothetical protein